MDRLLCDLQELVTVLKKIAGAGQGGRETIEASTSFRSFDTDRSGELAGRNPSRLAWHVHNATDGTLLIREGGEGEVTLQDYTYAIGPGENYDSGGNGEPYRGELHFAWVNEADHGTTLSSDYPAGVFAVAVRGSLTYTERTRK